MGSLHVTPGSFSLSRLWICSLTVLFVTSLACAIPSAAQAGLIIENNFSGSGNLEITLESGGIKDVVTCTSSSIAGQVSSPPDAKAKLTSWSFSSCTASSEGQSFGSAKVEFATLPSVEATALDQVKVSPATVKLEYKVGSSVCKPEVMLSNQYYSYSAGVSVNEFYGTAGHTFFTPFAPPLCLSGGIGFFRPTAKFSVPQFKVTESSVLYELRNSNSGGSPDITFKLMSQQAGDIPLAGDWNKDGFDSVGYFRPSNALFCLRNSNTTGSCDIAFQFGASGDRPVVGDWNEDGIDTVGVYRPNGGVFYLRDSNSAGSAQYQFQFGNTTPSEDLPISGDWNNSGTDTIGVYRPTNGVFYLRNTNSNGPPDFSFAYGNPGNDDLPIAGDWDENGFFSVGVFRQSVGTWFQDNEVPGDQPISYVHTFGPVGHTIPIVGDWNNSGTDTPGLAWK